MTAWTLYLYVDWEVAIADGLRPRFVDLADGDPRPLPRLEVDEPTLRMTIGGW